MDAEDPTRCGPLKRPEFAEDPAMTERFARQILLEEEHHAKSEAKRDLFSDESMSFMANMAMDVSKIIKLPKQELTRLLNRSETDSDSTSGEAGEKNRNAGAPKTPDFH